MRRTASLLVCLLLAACGSDRSEPLPAACAEGTDAVLRALETAPDPVRLDGTAISECFNRDSSGDDELIVGTYLISAGQQLSDRAREDPESAASVQLGYLVGAARRGSERNGLGVEMVRRLEHEPSGEVLESRAYRRGLRAGRATG